ncbi:MAG: 30S ribosomal protein S19 [Candidatus Nanoarchaeia archaeon]|nr:30S ribosomal protein S19 [Candidatus Nanoarchaeia archaeon]MDD5053985.1 30S ribosomal protein S19 [Candidatus Nanoarchaeia archaeon]MDD5499868.1 30S ribosomal protein S19 [Candidatus Nanoarchaeia archaeon]
MSEEKNFEQRKKVYYFKGKTYEELKSLSNEEVLKIIGARGKRSLIRGLSKPKQDLMKKVRASNELISKGKTQLKIKTHSRDMIILPEMIDLKIDVYNGKTFEPVNIKQEMIGHYLGEFVPTRKRVVHGSGAKSDSKMDKGAKK